MNKVAKLNPTQKKFAWVLNKSYACSKNLFGSQREAKAWGERLFLIAKANSKVELCTHESILATLLASIYCRLPLNSPHGTAYAIPRKNKNGKWELGFQTSYKGLLTLAARSDKYELFHSEIVYNDEEWEYRVENGIPKMLHVPKVGRSAPINILRNLDFKAVYASCLAKGAQHASVVVMSPEDVRLIRDRSDAYKKEKDVASPYGPWFRWPGGMVKKTAYKQLAKQLSQDDSALPEEFVKAVYYDSLSEAGRLKVDPETGELFEGKAPENKSEKKAAKAMKTVDATYKDITKKAKKK